VAADDGFADLFLIVRTAKNFLYDGGWLLLEHGFMQGEHVRQYLQQGGYQSVQTVCDLSGNERVTYAQWLTSANNG
jgi:release factor glutamine methyltransferase